MGYNDDLDDELGLDAHASAGMMSADEITGGDFLDTGNGAMGGGMSLAAEFGLDLDAEMESALDSNGEGITSGMGMGLDLGSELQMDLERELNSKPHHHFYRLHSGAWA